MEVTIKHDAKCKLCKHFEKGWYIKEDGTQSKKVVHFCNNEESDRYHQGLTLKCKACENFELISD